MRLEDWRAPAGRDARGSAPRTLLTLEAGRYAVVSGRATFGALYRAWCRHFDAWLAATGECPRAARVYLRFTEVAGSDGQLDFALHIPLEAPALHEAPAPHRSGASATPEFV